MRDDVYIGTRLLTEDIAQKGSDTSEELMPRQQV